MKTRIQKNENGLLLLIPDTFVKAMSLDVDSIVEISLLGRRLIIEPVHEQSLELNDLLLKVSKDNLRQEIEMGMSTGNEVW